MHSKEYKPLMGTFFSFLVWFHPSEIYKGDKGVPQVLLITHQDVLGSVRSYNKVLIERFWESQ